VRPGLAPVLLAVCSASAAACGSSEFWDRPYAVAGARSPAPRAVASAPRPAPAPLPPRPPPPAPPSPHDDAPAGDALADARSTLDAVNRVRAARGLAAFRWNDRLHDAARDHSAEQRLHGYMGHGSPDAARDDLADRLRIAGYRGRMWAEVVAKGYPDVPSVVDGWMRSKSHREILLDPDLEEAAFARDGTYWTGNFGTPLSGSPPRAAAPSPRPAAPPRRPARPVDSG
jgi:uncharacterized protein YkwD